MPVRRNLIHFHAHPEDVFVILSGDQLYRMDLSLMVEDHISCGAEVTVAAKPIPLSEANGLGLLRIGEQKQIIDFVEKPNDPEIISRLVPPELKASTEGDEDRCLASMGIMFLKHLPCSRHSREMLLISVREMIPSLVDSKILKCHVFDDYWEDIGTVRSFFEANLQLTEDKPLFDFYDEKLPIYNYPDILPTAKLGECSLSKTTVASGCRIGNFSFIRCMLGIRSEVGNACHFDNVVMMGADYQKTDIL